MGKQADKLAERLQGTTDAVIAAIEARRRGEDEARVLAHHLATCHALALSLAQAVINGEPIPSISWGMMHELNHQHVRANTTVGLPEALALLRSTTVSATGAIRQLTSEHLDTSVSWGLGAEGAPVSARSLIEQRMIAHAEEHPADLTASANRIPT